MDTSQFQLQPNDVEYALIPVFYLLEENIIMQKFLNKTKCATVELKNQSFKVNRHFFLLNQDLKAKFDTSLFKLHPNDVVFSLTSEDIYENIQ